MDPPAADELENTTLLSTVCLSPFTNSELVYQATLLVMVAFSPQLAFEVLMHLELGLMLVSGVSSGLGLKFVDSVHPDGLHDMIPDPVVCDNHSIGIGSAAPDGLGDTLGGGQGVWMRHP